MSGISLRHQAAQPKILPQQRILPVHAETPRSRLSCAAVKITLTGVVIQPLTMYTETENIPGGKP